MTKNAQAHRAVAITGDDMKAAAADAAEAAEAMLLNVMRAQRAAAVGDAGPFELLLRDEIERAMAIRDRLQEIARMAGAYKVTAAD